MTDNPRPYDSPAPGAYLPEGSGPAVSPWLPFLLILACTFIAYIPAIGAGFIWDDEFHVFANPHMIGLDGLRRIWFTTESQQYYPLVYSSFWLEYQLWGANPMGYHVVNIFLHSLNSFFVYLIFRRLGVRGALAVALVFALHPVHVESVAWVSERKNVLSGLFYLAALGSYLRFDDGGGRGSYARSLVLFFCALLSKTVTSTLPPALIIIRWMRGRAVRGTDLLRLVPFFAVGLVMGLVTVVWEVKFVGASGSEFALSTAERLLLPGRVVWFYISKLLWPAELTFIYERWNLDPGDPAAWLYPAALVAALLALYFLRGRIGRWAAGGLAYFVLTLLPALGFFNVYPFRYSFVADHFQYLASLGVIGVVVGYAAWGLGRLPAGAASRYVKTGVAAVVLVVLGSLSFSQERIYEGLEPLWRDTLEKNPAAWMAHTNLGNVLYYTGREDEAREHFFRAIELNPSYEVPYYNIGNDLTRRGFIDEANRYYRKSIEIRPGYGDAHYNLAGNLSSQGRFEEALFHYRKAAETDPGDADIRVNLGNALARLGRFAEASEQYEAALAIDPGSATAQRNIEYVRRAMRRGGD
ncbi:MAG: tetratricopeptide repeat protein [Thermodesulfobacteriota bacterium]